MNTPNNQRANLIKTMLNENSISIRALDISAVEFDKKYYRMRDRQIRRYKRNLLTDYSEKLMLIAIKIFLSLATLFLFLTIPVIPIVLFIATIVRSEENSHESLLLSSIQPKARR